MSSQQEITYKAAAAIFPSRFEFKNTAIECLEARSHPPERELFDRERTRRERLLQQSDPIPHKPLEAGGNILRRRSVDLSGHWQRNMWIMPSK